MEYTSQGDNYCKGTLSRLRFSSSSLALYQEWQRNDVSNKQEKYLMFNLIIQSFGNESEYRRAIFLYYSFKSVISDEQHRILIFSDNISYFKERICSADIEYVNLSNKSIHERKGGLDFIHRIKISIIEEVLLKYQETILYADSDSFFISDPQEYINIVSGNDHMAFMHKNEYQFKTLKEMRLPAGKPFMAIAKYIENNGLEIYNDVGTEVHLNHSSFNAGIMILPHSTLAIISKIYKLSELFYSKTQNHASEQYAFSIILQDSYELNSCEKISYHYWYRIEKQIIDEFLKENIASNWIKMNENIKLQHVSEWIFKLPKYIQNHRLFLKDSSIQYFHEGNYKNGYLYALKTLTKNPFDWIFYLDILYHTKKLFSSYVKSN